MDTKVKAMAAAVKVSLRIAEEKKSKAEAKGDANTTAYHKGRVDTLWLVAKRMEELLGEG